MGVFLIPSRFFIQHFDAENKNGTRVNDAPSDSDQPQDIEYPRNGRFVKARAYSARIFSSLRYPAYRMYVYSMVGHWASMQMQQFVGALLIYRLTNAGVVIGYMALAHSIPMVLLSLYGGALADRVEKRQMLLWSQVAAVLLSLMVALTLTTGYLSAENAGSWWVIIFSSAVQGIIFGLMMPARITVMPEIVEPKDLMNAISINNMGMNLFRIIAPAVTAFIVASWDFTAAYYVITLLNLSSIFFIFGLPKLPPRQTSGRNPVGEIIEGMQYMRKESILILILAFTLGCTILGQPFNMLLPMFTDNPDLIGGGEIRQGWLMTVSGIGAIVVSFTLASLQNKKRGLIMLIMGIILSASLKLFSFNTVWVPALLYVFLIGAGQTGQMAIGTTLVQYKVDPVYRGRVMSFLMLGFGLSSLGTVFGGVLADAMGIQWAVGGLAMVLLGLTVAILLFGKRLRRLD